MAQRTTRQQHELKPENKLPPHGIGHLFSRFSQRVADMSGSPWVFMLAVAAIGVWLVTGPIFGFSDTWQLIANTVTTLITTLMVFLIQNTQNRDSRALHLKLDELIRATPRARKEFMEAEEEDLDEIEREKAIVDEADPNPPAHKRSQRAERPAVPANGNGKPNRTP
ncbi:MAG TPA: low affinity iron permease family protein [Candidatus Acidoferrales bacterium]|nr:low affinity iron permease family protein [Candidatus Acidoferrales bacterium]